MNSLLRYLGSVYHIETNSTVDGSTWSKKRRWIRFSELLCQAIDDIYSLVKVY